MKVLCCVASGCGAVNASIGGVESNGGDGRTRRRGLDREKRETRRVSTAGVDGGHWRREETRLASPSHLALAAAATCFVGSSLHELIREATSWGKSSGAPPRLGAGGDSQPISVRVRPSSVFVDHAGEAPRHSPHARHPFARHTAARAGSRAALRAASTRSQAQTALETRRPPLFLCAAACPTARIHPGECGERGAGGAEIAAHTGAVPRTQFPACPRSTGLHPDGSPRFDARGESGR